MPDRTPELPDQMRPCQKDMPDNWNYAVKPDNTTNSIKEQIKHTKRTGEDCQGVTSESQSLVLMASILDHKNPDPQALRALGPLPQISLAGETEKINTFVRFPLELDMAPFVVGPGHAAQYRLYAVVNHSGVDVVDP